MTQSTNEICVVQDCSNSCYEHFRQCYLHLKRAAQKLRAPQKKASLEQFEWLGSLETRNCCVVNTEYISSFPGVLPFTYSASIRRYDNNKPIMQNFVKYKGHAINKIVKVYARVTRNSLDKEAEST